MSTQTPHPPRAPTESAATIRPVRDDERAELERVVGERWGSPLIVSRGTGHRIVELPCLVSTDEAGRWLGLAAYHLEGDSCELVLLEALVCGHGTGTTLLDAVIGTAVEAGARRLWLVTTNDNTDALRFYQRRGFSLVGLRVGAVTQARAQLKPEIPLLGENGIPIRDELELELALEPETPTRAGTAEGPR